ncbi:hypothetical protein KP509_23G040200 [Ceratopteris richardii]|uniref:Retrotransposon gag domain-containing protein n=1 Tax=Ceratopteris richardii TaxID=49495 RepID=A0A8T2S1F3_CERRI|nr:hypothetical protein KP509_23G040200 [Ceratopteris richardii]
MTRTRSSHKEGSLSIVKTPIKSYQRKRLHYIPPRAPPLPFPFRDPSSLRGILDWHSMPPSTDMADNQRPQAVVMGHDLTNLLSRINIKFPSFKAAPHEDADDHVRRFVSLCKSRGLHKREDAFLALFPATLKGLADRRYNQHDEAHFTTWDALKTAFTTTFTPGNSTECILAQLENLKVQKGEAFSELMTRVKSLVSHRPHNLGDFLVKKWVEKALPKTSQQKLRQLLQPDASLEEFEAAASRIEAARVQLKEHEGMDEFTSDPLAQLRREL